MVQAPLGLVTAVAALWSTMTSLVRVVAYTLCSTARERLQELAQEFGDADIMISIGTRRRTIDDHIGTQNDRCYHYWHWEWRARQLAWDHDYEEENDNYWIARRPSRDGPRS